MKILQAGLAKSGNFWIYKILQKILNYGGIENRSFIQNHPIASLSRTWELSHDDQAGIDVLDIQDPMCFFRISSIFRMPIVDLDDYLDQCSHVWSHSKFCENCREVFSKFDKIVYIIRDPRDRALSAARFAYTPYMQKYYPTKEATPALFLENALDDMMQGWVQHVGGYLKNLNSLGIYLVFYERFLHDFDNELAALLEYLEVPLSAEHRTRIRDAVAFKAMKDKNPRHVQKGSSNQWIGEMDRHQIRRAERIAGPMLGLLHYPINDYVEEKSLPQISNDITISKIEKAMVHSRRKSLLDKSKQIAKLLFTQ